MTPEMRQAKLRKLCAIEGYDGETELFAAVVADSVCPAICCIEEKEPDSRNGWCEECGRGTMVSALVLGGLI